MTPSPFQRQRGYRTVAEGGENKIRKPRKEAAGKPAAFLGNSARPIRKMHKARRCLLVEGEAQCGTQNQTVISHRDNHLFRC